MSIPLSRTGAGPSPLDTGQNKPSAPRQLDFMLVTSRSDFKSNADQFSRECKAAGAVCTVLYIEDLPGNTANEKLQQLHKVNATWQSKGFIARSTIKVVLLHGRSVSLPPSATSNASPHLMSIPTGDLAFSTGAFDAAMRNITSKDGIRSVGFSDTVIYASCGVGAMRQAFKHSGGSYLLLAGMKAVFLDDGMTCMSDLIQEAGQRKREESAPLTARECWMRASQLSGEHIAYLKDNVLEVSKVTPPDHAALHGETKRPAPLKIFRAISSKLCHGSAATVQRLFELWGPEAIRQAMQSSKASDVSLLRAAALTNRQLDEKLQLLERYGFGLPDPSEQMLACLSTDISPSDVKLLLLIFRQCTSGSRQLDPATLIKALKKAPKAQTTLAELCNKHPEVKQAFTDFLQSHADPHPPALPFAELLPELRHIAMAPSLADLPQWLADELLDYPDALAGKPGQDAAHVAFDAWRTLLSQKRYGDAHEFLAAAFSNVPDDMRRVLREQLPNVFSEALASNNIKLARTLAILDYERGLRLGLLLIEGSSGA